MIEEWRIIADGFYSASSLGRIRREKPGRGTRPGRILRPSVGGPGYPMVTAVPDGQRRAPYYLHRIIADVFLGPCPAGMQVNHKDGDKTNCRVSNLEYVTPGENNVHALRTGLRRAARKRINVGARNPLAKLCDDDVRSIRAEVANGTRRKELAARFGVSPSSVDMIVQGRRWRHVA